MIFTSAELLHLRIREDMLYSSSTVGTWRAMLALDEQLDNTEEGFIYCVSNASAAAGTGGAAGGMGTSASSSNEPSKLVTSLETRAKPGS